MLYIPYTSKIAAPMPTLLQVVHVRPKSETALYLLCRKRVCTSFAKRHITETECITHARVGVAVHRTDAVLFIIGRIERNSRQEKSGEPIPQNGVLLILQLVPCYSYNYHYTVSTTILLRRRTAIGTKKMLNAYSVRKSCFVTLTQHLDFAPCVEYLI